MTAVVARHPPCCRKYQIASNDAPDDKPIANVGGVVVPDPELSSQPAKARLEDLESRASFPRPPISRRRVLASLD